MSDGSLATSVSLAPLPSTANVVSPRLMPRSYSRPVTSAIRPGRSSHRMETSAVWFAISVSLHSNDIGLADRLAVQHPIIAEAAQIERAITAERDELAERAADRRRLLQAVA